MPTEYTIVAAKAQKTGRQWLHDQSRPNPSRMAKRGKTSVQNRGPNEWPAHHTGQIEIVRKCGTIAQSNQRTSDQRLSFSATAGMVARAKGTQGQNMKRPRLGLNKVPTMPWTIARGLVIQEVAPP